MKKIKTLLILVLLVSGTTYAQLGMKKKIEEAKEISSRTLLIALESENINEKDFKSAIKDGWTYNESIEFISNETLKERQKQKSDAKKYAYLIFSDKARNSVFPENSIRVGLLENNTPTYYQMVAPPKSTVNKADLLFGTQRLQDYIVGMSKYTKMSKKEIMNSFKEAGKLAEQVKDKMLLIDASVINDKLQKTIESKYKYDYQIVPKEDIDQAILTKSDEVYIIRGNIQAQPPRMKSKRDVAGVNSSGQVVNSSGSTTPSFKSEQKETELVAMIYSVYDPLDGSVIYTFGIPQSGMKFGTPTRLTAKDFEEFVKLVN